MRAAAVLLVLLHRLACCSRLGASCQNLRPRVPASNFGFGFCSRKSRCLSTYQVENTIFNSTIYHNTAVAYPIMAAKSGDKSPKVEKSVKKDKSDKKSKKDKKSSVEKQEKAATAAASLLADKKAVNPALSSLFAAQVCCLVCFIITSILLTNTAHTTHSPRDCPGARTGFRG